MRSIIYLRKVMAVVLLISVVSVVAGCLTTIKRGKVSVDVNDYWMGENRIYFLLNVSGLQASQTERVSFAISKEGRFSVLEHFDLANGIYKIYMSLDTEDHTPLTLYSVTVYLSDNDPEKPFQRPIADPLAQQRYDKHIADGSWAEENIIDKKWPSEIPTGPKKPVPENAKVIGR